MFKRLCSIMSIMVVLLLVPLCASRKCVNVSVLLSHIAEEYRNDEGSSSYPFINNGNYLQVLSNFVCKSTYDSVLAVMGPKDSGKTTGINKIIPAWTDQFVVQINLRGYGTSIENTMVFKQAASKLREFLRNVDKPDATCIFRYIQNECYENYDFVAQADQLLGQYNNLPRLVSIFTLLCSAFGFQIKNRYIGALVIILILIAAIVIWYSDYIWLSWLTDPVSDVVSTGKMKFLTCILNSISHCLPQSRPILIIHEMNLLEKNARIELLNCIEVAKQGYFKFPVILELSDFLWTKEALIRNMLTSLDLYLIKEPIFEDCYAELVEKYQIWTKDEFHEIYDKVGCNMGLLRQVHRQTVVSTSLETTLENLAKISFETFFGVATKFEHKKRFHEWLLKFKQNNFTEDPEATPNDIKLLLSKENLIFCVFETYLPNTLVKHSMSKYITEYVVNQTTQ